LVGRELLGLLHPEDRDGLRRIADPPGRAQAVPEARECRLITRSGQLRWVTVRHTPIRYRGGVVTLGNVEDVTDHRRLEAELRSLSARLLSVQEEERRRVARDLHDSIGQTLGAIKFSLEAALGRPFPNERRGNITRLRSLVPMLQAAVKEVRRISTALRPPILDDLGLLTTMAWHLREFQRTYPHIAVDAHWSAEESDIPQALKTPVFRILQEATHNVAKHSQAHRLSVSLAAEGTRLRLTVRDDGAGFDLATPNPDGGDWGSGLSSMRERTELSGGAFCMTSAPGAGTTVEALWPLDQAAVSG
jgi:signal transduction histidine kinase